MKNSTFWPLKSGSKGQVTSRTMRRFTMTSCNLSETAGIQMCVYIYIYRCIYIYLFIYIHHTLPHIHLYLNTYLDSRKCMVQLPWFLHPTCMPLLVFSKSRFQSSLVSKVHNSCLPGHLAMSMVCAQQWPLGGKSHRSFLDGTHH